ncbi:MAG: signal peptidase II [Pseudomonadota bacterium]
MSTDRLPVSVANDLSSSPWWRFRFAILAAVLVVVLGLDQSSKLWARDALARPAPPSAAASGSVLNEWAYWPARDIVLLQGLFHFQYAENRAAAFSLTRSLDESWRKPLLLGVGALAMVLIVGWLWRLKEPDPVTILALSFILAGAIGNAIDRMWHGYVIDFVSWRLERFFPSLPPWPTFNVADSAIVCGALAVIFRSFVPFKQAAELRSAPVTASPEQG